MCMTLKRTSKAMSVISKQSELIEMSKKRYIFKHFLNIGKLDAQMFTGNSICKTDGDIGSEMNGETLFYNSDC